MPPCASHNTPYIQLIQYGRRIGEKVYWEISPRVMLKGYQDFRHFNIQQETVKNFFVFLFFGHDWCINVLMQCVCSNFNRIT